MFGTGEVDNLMDEQSNSLSLKLEEISLHFTKVGLKFSTTSSSVPPWAHKNNKSVRETLEHYKYTKLRSLCNNYLSELDRPLGAFLLDLRERGDLLYKHFLNSDGDAVFTEFSLVDSGAARLRGLYIYKVGQEIVYVGRCLDCFGKRINQGYGKIHPKNCYIDGQRTNCRLNALVASNKTEIALYICPLELESDISQLESRLLRTLRPSWNRQFS
jgi:hypothetical protein